MPTKSEPLINKRIGIASESTRFVEFDEFAGFRFEDVKAAAEFYLKYFSKPEELLKDYPKLEKEQFDPLGATLGELVENFYDLDESEWWKLLDLYNMWLFKYAFRDVFSQEEK